MALLNFRAGSAAPTLVANSLHAQLRAQLDPRRALSSAAPTLLAGSLRPPTHAQLRARLDPRRALSSVAPPMIASSLRPPPHAQLWARLAPVRALSSAAVDAGHLHPPPDSQLQAVFTVGVPGAGKTHIYESRSAYEWADARVGEKFEAALAACVPQRLLVFHGTGTKLATRIARMDEAKAAGYTTTLLYVHVHLETELERNRNRERKLEAPHVDVVHVVENDLGPQDDDHSVSLPHSPTEGVKCMTPLRSIPRDVLNDALEQLEGDGEPETD
ncbi:hypothetical protein T492DRAFT_859435 [Pavlovales sp. CCMP2436]|nr:hypothetical protein T492DRAFT_859435 [Pavlovales sp. CCMP2436]